MTPLSTAVAHAVPVFELLRGTDEPMLPGTPFVRGLGLMVVSAVGVLGARAWGEEPLREHQPHAYSPTRAGFPVPVVAVLVRPMGAPSFMEVGIVGRSGLGQPSDLEFDLDAQIADLLESGYATSGEVAHGIEFHLRHTFADSGITSAGGSLGLSPTGFPAAGFPASDQGNDERRQHALMDSRRLRHCE